MAVELSLIQTQRHVRFAEREEVDDPFSRLFDQTGEISETILQLETQRKIYVERIQSRLNNTPSRIRRAWRHLDRLEIRRRSLDEKNRSILETIRKVNDSSESILDCIPEIQEKAESNQKKLSVEVFWKDESEYYLRLVDQSQAIEIAGPETIEDWLEDAEIAQREIPELILRAERHLKDNCLDLIESELLKAPLEEDQEAIRELWKNLLRIEKKRKIIEVNSRSQLENIKPNDDPRTADLEGICRDNLNRSSFERFWTGELRIYYQNLERLGSYSRDIDAEKWNRFKIISEMRTLLIVKKNHTLKRFEEGAEHIWYDLRAIENLRKGLWAHAKSKEDRSTLSFKSIWPNEQGNLYKEMEKLHGTRIKPCCILM